MKSSIVGIAAVALLGIPLTTINNPARGQEPAVEVRSGDGSATAGSSESAAVEFAPPGAKHLSYLSVPEAAKGPPVDPLKGYRIEELGDRLFMITDNVYQSMFMVYPEGVVVMDAPPSYSDRIMKAIREITDKPVTHVIYSHSHTDHIGGVTALEGHPIIVAQDETMRLLTRAADPRRPVPTLTFANTYELRLGDQVIQLSYHGNGHEPGNIHIYAPAQRTLMFIDVIFPGWMPFRRLAVAQDVPGYLDQVRELDGHPFEKLVSGHVSRIGNHEDVRVQIDFDADLQVAAAAALKAQPFVADAGPKNLVNPWALVDDYTRRVAAQCVVALAPKWKARLAAFDTYIWDQCYTMEQSLRID